MIELHETTADDDARLAEIAAEGDSTDASPAYLAFVRSSGRLLAASDGDMILGFAGMVPVGEVAMVTDLFIAAESRGHGIGGRLLGTLLESSPQRMTFSSSHPSAVPAYRRAGMEPKWRLRYLSGRAVGGGLPLVPASWRHDRADLVEHFRSEGAIVGHDIVVHVGARGAVVQRLVSDRAESEMQWLLEALPSGTTVWCRVPEHRPLAGWLEQRGFWESEHDLFCASPDVDLDPAVSCVHPGLL